MAATTGTKPNKLFFTNYISMRQQWIGALYMKLYCWDNYCYLEDDYLVSKIIYFIFKSENRLQ